MLIKIHSFIDVITNSSTEIYVRADKGSIESVKKLVNGLLELGGSSKTADDLFEFNLYDSSVEDRVNDRASDWLYDNREDYAKLEWDKKSKIIDKLVNKVKTMDPKDMPEWYTEALEVDEDSSSFISIDVVPKSSDATSAEVAKILSSLNNLFETGEYSC